MTNKRIFLSPPHMSGRELEYVKKAFDSNYIAPLGPMVDEFEKVFCEYLDIPYCVALSSGTAAMHLILSHLGVGAGDTVFASTLTFIGSVSSIKFLGAQPVFIDCDRKSWNMDPSLLEDALEEADKAGRLPKAVVPTDLYGQSCDLLRIVAICDKYEVPVICDSAESLGAKYQDVSRRGAESAEEEWISAGKGAYASVYSFNGNKIITTSGGGMLATEDKCLADHARKLATQARDDAPHYEHSEIGYNYRMSNIVAAIGVGQMEVLEERVTRKQEIFELYRKLFNDVPGIEFMPEADYGKPNRWLTVILIDESICGTTPETVRLALEEENIEARPVWKPMHCQPVFAGCQVCGGGVAEDLFARGLCLPSGTAMTDQDVERVASLVKAVVSNQ